MYEEPGANVLNPSPLFPSTFLSTGRCLTNKAAASGSKAIVNISESIPACQELTADKINPIHRGI